MMKIARTVILKIIAALAVAGVFATFAFILGTLL